DACATRDPGDSAVPARFPLAAQARPRGGCCRGPGLGPGPAGNTCFDPLARARLAPSREGFLRSTSRLCLCDDRHPGDRIVFRIAVIAALALATLAGCNTVKGVGQDIQSVGEAADRAI